MKNTCAICVTYNPEPKLLYKVLSACALQVEQVFILDNGSNDDIRSWIPEAANIEPVLLEKNRGIAAAFNEGIKRARAEGFQYVLLLDQDSVIPDKIVEQYRTLLDHLRAAGHSVAAIGPRYVNPRTKQISSFFRFEWFYNRRLKAKELSTTVPTDFLISSGSFYPIDVFEKVGLFDKNLFIDHVDTEWCLRAAHRGLQCFGAAEIIMEHSLGENEVQLWVFGRRTQPLHKPFRLYYIVRNSLLLYRMPHVPLKWISGDILRLARLLLMYCLFAPQRGVSIDFFFKGFADGVRGVVGQAPNH